MSKNQNVGVENPEKITFKVSRINPYFVTVMIILSDQIWQGPRKSQNIETNTRMACTTEIKHDKDNSARKRLCELITHLLCIWVVSGTLVSIRPIFAERHWSRARKQTLYACFFFIGFMIKEEYQSSLRWRMLSPLTLVHLYLCIK